jgi:hypothetical protein
MAIPYIVDKKAKSSDIICSWAQSHGYPRETPVAIVIFDYSLLLGPFAEK